MTPEQLAVLLHFLKPGPCLAAALQAVLLEGQAATDAAQFHQCDSALLLQQLARVQALDQQIRQAYVLHGPTEFRIMVGHHSHDRMPGERKLQVGQSVRLIAHATEHWIPIQITALPKNRHDYYRGTILEQRVPYSKFQVGNCVLFSEDQVA